MRMMMTQINENDYTDRPVESVKSSVKNRWNHVGQSTIEYLIVAAVIIAALLAVRGLLRNRVQAIFRNAINQVR